MIHDYRLHDFPDTVIACVRPLGQEHRCLRKAGSRFASLFRISNLKTFPDGAKSSGREKHPQSANKTPPPHPGWYVSGPGSLTVEQYTRTPPNTGPKDPCCIGVYETRQKRGTQPKPSEPYVETPPQLGTGNRINAPPTKHTRAR